MPSMTCAADTVVLPRTDISTSRVGFGCARIMRLTSQKERQRLLGVALDEGVRHFDVARMYGFGAAEKELGTFLKGKRSEATVATKFGIEPRNSISRLKTIQCIGRRLVQHVPLVRRVLRRSSRLVYAPKDFSRKAAESSLNVSLKELGTDYIDIFFLHEPTQDDAFCDDLHAFLDRAQRTGKIRAFGLSGDLDDILLVCAKLALNAPVLQFASNVFKCDAARVILEEPRATVLFSTISPALEPAMRAITLDAAGRAGLESRLGGVVMDSSAVARLLLWHAVQQNKHGITLFSAGTPERLRNLVAQGVDETATELFARIARQEGKP